MLNVLKKLFHFIARILSKLEMLGMLEKLMKWHATINARNTRRARETG